MIGFDPQKEYNPGEMTKMAREADKLCRKFKIGDYDPRRQREGGVGRRTTTLPMLGAYPDGSDDDAVAAWLTTSPFPRATIYPDVVGVAPEGQDVPDDPVVLQRGRMPGHLSLVACDAANASKLRSAQDVAVRAPPPAILLPRARGADAFWINVLAA